MKQNIIGRILLGLLTLVIVLGLPSLRHGLQAQGTTHGVSLTWTAGVPTSGQIAATGWKVNRSLTTGGPYTQISAVTVTNYLDTTGTAGTKYFYVVVGTAPNALDSAPSNEVSSTFLQQVAPAVSLGAASQ